MKNVLLVLAAGLALSSAALAQAPQIVRTEGALRQLQSAGQRQSITSLSNRYADGDVAPELYPGESADVGPQYLMIAKVKRTLFEVGADVQYFYTSNMLLSEKGNTDTGILISTTQFAFAPTPYALGDGHMALRAGYRQQFYLYGLDDTSNQLNNFDFSVGTVFLNARYTTANHWTGFVGFEYNRLISHVDNWNEFYTELLPTWGVEKQIPFGENKILSLAYVGAQHFTHTDPAPTNNASDRLDSILSATWSWQFYPGFILQPFYRFQHTHYWENSDRNDFFHTVGASLTWLINDWASLRTFTSWELRDSNDPAISDYEKFDTGVGVSAIVRF